MGSFNLAFIATKSVVVGKHIRHNTPGVENIYLGDPWNMQAVTDMIHNMQKAQYYNHRHTYSSDLSKAGGAIYCHADVEPRHICWNSMNCEEKAYC